MIPSEKRLARLEKSGLIATRGSYDKQMAVLEKYPEELGLARKLGMF